MLQRHKRIFMNTKCTFKCRETIMTAAIEAGQRIGACLHTDGSSGSPGQDDAGRIKLKSDHFQIVRSDRIRSGDQIEVRSKSDHVTRSCDRIAIRSISDHFQIVGSNRVVRLKSDHDAGGLKQLLPRMPLVCRDQRFFCFLTKYSWPAVSSESAWIAAADFEDNGDLGTPPAKITGSINHVKIMVSKAIKDVTLTAIFNGKKEPSKLNKRFESVKTTGHDHEGGQAEDARRALARPMKEGGQAEAARKR